MFSDYLAQTLSKLGGPFTPDSSHTIVWEALADLAAVRGGELADLPGFVSGLEIGAQADRFGNVPAELGDELAGMVTSYVIAARRLYDARETNDHDEWERLTAELADALRDTTKLYPPNLSAVPLEFLARLWHVSDKGLSLAGVDLLHYTGQDAEKLAAAMSDEPPAELIRDVQRMGAALLAASPALVDEADTALMLPDELAAAEALWDDRDEAAMREPGRLATRHVRLVVEAHDELVSAIRDALSRYAERIEELSGETTRGIRGWL